MTVYRLEDRVVLEGRILELLAECPMSGRELIGRLDLDNHGFFNVVVGGLKLDGTVDIKKEMQDRPCGKTERVPVYYLVCRRTPRATSAASVSAPRHKDPTPKDIERVKQQIRAEHQAKLRPNQRRPG